MKKPNEVVATLAVTVKLNRISTIKRLNEGPGLTLRGFLHSVAIADWVGFQKSRISDFSGNLDWLVNANMGVAGLYQVSAIVPESETMWRVQ